MAPILSSEIARLVLGYLEESKCEQSYKSFLEANKDLKECLHLYRSGKHIPTDFMGKTLVDILEEYVNIHSLVQNHIKKLKSDEQKDKCLPAVLPITASLFDQVRVLIDASSTSQTMLLSITLPANSNNSFSCKTKARNGGSKSEKVINKHKRSGSIGESDDRNKKDNSGFSVDDSDMDICTPIKHKNSTELFRSSSKDEDEINESAKVEIIAKAILEKPELQEKIAENINLIRNTPNESAPASTSVPISKPTEDIPDYGILNPSNILDNELDIIKTIVDKTERDPVFEKFLDEIVGPVAEIASDENVYSSCSMTSTPQRSRSIPRVQLNTRRRFSNVRSLPDVRKMNRNKIPLRDRLRNVKQKNLDNILAKSDEKQLNLKSIDDHNAAAIQSIINAGTHKINENIPISEDGCENRIDHPQTAITEQEGLAQVSEAQQQDIHKILEKNKFSVTTSIENVLEVPNKVFEEKTTNSTLNSLINDIFTPTQQAVPSTTSNGDVILFEGSLDKYLQSSHILPPSYSTQSTTHNAPQKQVPPTGMILQPPSLLVQQPTGGYFMLNHNIVSAQQPLLISQDAISASSVNTEISSPFYIVQNTSMLNYPSSNVLNFAVQQPKIEISVPKPQSLIKSQSDVTTNHTPEIKSSSISAQEIMEMPMIMCAEQESVDQKKTIEKPKDILLNEKKNDSLNPVTVTEKNKKCNFRRKVSKRNSRKWSKPRNQKKSSQLKKASDSLNETVDITDKTLDNSSSKNELGINKKLDNTVDNKVQTADFVIDTSNQSKSQTKRRIVPVLISSQTESINRVFQECHEQITLYSTNNVADTVVVDSNRNRLNLSENSEKCDKPKSKTPESLIKNTSEFCKAQSTPKSGGRSHIRALNFSTPPKSTDMKTSICKEVKDVQCRMKLFDKDKNSEVVKNFSELETKISLNIPIATRSPMQKLKADWDKVQGVGLIFGVDNSPIIKQNNSEIKTKRKRSFSESDLISTPSKNQLKENFKYEKNYVHKEINDDDQKNLRKPSWDSDLRALVSSSPPKKKMKRIVHKKESVDNSNIDPKKPKKGKNVLNSSDEVEVLSPVTRRITRSCTSPKKNNYTPKENLKVIPETVKKKVTKKIVIKPRTKNKRASPEIDSKQVETVKCESAKKEIKSALKIEEMERLICTVDEEYIRNKNRPRKFRKKCNLSTYTDPTENVAPVVTFDKSRVKIELSTNIKCESNENIVDVIDNGCNTRSLPEILHKEVAPAVNVDKSQISLNKIEHNFEKPQHSLEKSNHNFEIEQHGVKIISDTNITPELTKQLTSFPITSTHNLIPLFETPVKEDFSGIPITPRFLSPFSTIDTPITKLLKEQTNIINESIVPISSFPPMTPNVILTPKLPDSGSPSGYFNRGTDYSTCSSSYYQPSDSDQNALEHMLITECAKYERNETREFNRSEDGMETNDDKEEKNIGETPIKDICSFKKTGDIEMDNINKVDSIKEITDIKDTGDLEELNDDKQPSSVKKKTEVEKTMNDIKEMCDVEETRNIEERCDIKAKYESKETSVNNMSNAKGPSSIVEMRDVLETTDIKKNNDKEMSDIKRRSNVKNINRVKRSSRAREMGRIKANSKTEKISNVIETSNIVESVYIKESNDVKSESVTNDIKEVSKINSSEIEVVNEEKEIIPYTLLEISLPEREFSKVLDKTKYESTSNFEDDNARDTDGNGCVLKISGSLLKEVTPITNHPEINLEVNVLSKSKTPIKDKNSSNSSSDSSSSSSVSCSSDSSTSNSDSSFTLAEENETVIQKGKNCVEESNSFRYPLRDRLSSKGNKNDSNELVENISIEDNKLKNIDVSVQNKDLSVLHKNSSKPSVENVVHNIQENKKLKIDLETPQSSTSSHESTNIQEGSYGDIEADQKLFNELQEKRQRIIEKLQAFSTTRKKNQKAEKNILKKVEKSEQPQKVLPRNKQGKFLSKKTSARQKNTSKMITSPQVLSENVWEIVNNENDSFPKDSLKGEAITETGLKLPQVPAEMKMKKDSINSSEGTSSTKVKSAQILKTFIRNNKQVSNETQQESDSESSIALVTHLKERGILLVPNKKKSKKPCSPLVKCTNKSEQSNETETIRIKTKKPLKSSLYSSHESNMNENIKILDVKHILKGETVNFDGQVSEKEGIMDSNTNILNGSTTVDSKSKLNSQKRHKNKMMLECQEDKTLNKETSKAKSVISKINISNKKMGLEALNENKLLDNSKKCTLDDFQKVSPKGKDLVESIRCSTSEKVELYSTLNCRDTSDYISFTYDESQVKPKKVDYESAINLSVYEVELDLHDEFEQQFVHTISASPLLHFLDVAPKRVIRVKPIKIIRRRHVIKKLDNENLEMQGSSKQIPTFQNIDISEKEKVEEDKSEKTRDFGLDSLAVDSHDILDTKVKRQTPLDILCAELSDNTNDTSFDSFVNETTMIKVPLSSTSVYPESIQESHTKFLPQDSCKEIKLEFVSKNTSEYKSCFQTGTFHKNKIICNRDKEVYTKGCKSKRSLQKYDEEKCSNKTSTNLCYSDRHKFDKQQIEPETTEKLSISKMGDLVSRLNESLEEGECSADDDDVLMTYALTGEDPISLTSKLMSLKKRKISENQEVNISKRLKPNDPQTLLKKLDLDSFLRQVHGPDE